MSRAVVDQLVHLLDRSFDGNDEHSLLANIREITGDLWHAKPPGGGRTIAGVIWHAGAAKYLYYSHTFGDGSITWDHELAAPSHAKTIEGALPWIRGGHRRFVKAVRELEDGGLDATRRMHWGQPATVRFSIETMIEHDAFHAGEINHIRAVLQGNDRWGYFGPPGDPEH